MQGCEYVPQLYGAYMLRAREGNKLATTLCCVMQLLPISLSTMRKVRGAALRSCWSARRPKSLARLSIGGRSIERLFSQTWCTFQWS